MSAISFSVAAQQIVATAPIFYGTITAGSTVTLYSRLTDQVGNSNLTGEVTGISAVVTDMGLDTAGSPITINPATAVLSALSLNGWTVDAIGWNLQVPLDGLNFATPGTVYQVVVTLTASSGSVSTIIWQLQTDHAV